VEGRVSHQITRRGEKAAINVPINRMIPKRPSRAVWESPDSSGRIAPVNPVKESNPVMAMSG
jgi:hypothetical protein